MGKIEMDIPENIKINDDIILAKSIDGAYKCWDNFTIYIMEYDDADEFGYISSWYWQCVSPVLGIAEGGTAQSLEEAVERFKEYIEEEMPVTDF